jgi:poly(3-hydroxybutyrate) depolymerase
VGLCAFTDAGHTWAGGRYTGGDACKDPESYLCKRYFEILGPINEEILLNDLIWNFFTSLEKKDF